MKYTHNAISIILPPLKTTSIGRFIRLLLHCMSLNMTEGLTCVRVRFRGF